jgi:hypothetical protein
MTTAGNKEIPAALPEIRVSDMTAALDYYEHALGFNLDCGVRMAASRASREGRVASS